MELFSIQCTTCRVRLKVNNESVIGDILACPKCGSMVLVVPPVGWERPPSGEVSAADSASAVLRKSAVAAPPVANPKTPAPATTPTPVPAAIERTPAKAAAVPPALPQRPATSAAEPARSATQPQAQAARPERNRKQLLLVPQRSRKRARAPGGAAAGGLARTAIPVTPSAPPLSIAGRGLASIRREWIVMAGGLGGGMRCGAAVWLALAAGDLQPTTTDDDAVPTVARKRRRSSVPRPSRRLPATPRCQHRPSRPNADAPLAVAEKAEPTVDAQAVAEPTEKEEQRAASDAVSVPDAADAPASDVAAVPPATEPAGGPAMKLEPVPANPAPAAGAEPAAPSVANEAESPEEPAVAEKADGAAAPGDMRAASGSTLTDAEIEQRLAASLAAIDFVNVPLTQFADFISEMTQVPIAIDGASLKAKGKRRETPVTVKLKRTTAAAALEAATSKLGLSTTVSDGKIVISAGGADPPITVSRGRAGGLRNGSFRLSALGSLPGAEGDSLIFAARTAQKIGTCPARFVPTSVAGGLVGVEVKRQLVLTLVVVVRQSPSRCMTRRRPRRVAAGGGDDGPLAVALFGIAGDDDPIAEAAQPVAADGVGEVGGERATAAPRAEHRQPTAAAGVEQSRARQRQAAGGGQLAIFLVDRQQHAHRRLVGIAGRRQRIAPLETRGQAFANRAEALAAQPGNAAEPAIAGGGKDFFERVGPDRLLQARASFAPTPGKVQSSGNP